MDMLSTEALEKIFASHLKRSIFISEYEHFLEDSHGGFYARFILDHYRAAKTALLVDLMELAIKTGFFDRDFFDFIFSQYATKRFWYRLAALDYLSSVRGSIGKDEYERINREILNKPGNLELQFQAAANLILSDSSVGRTLFSIIEKAAKVGNHYVLYRAVHFLTDPAGPDARQSLKQDVRELIDKKASLPEAQRKELLNYLAHEGK
jgi:hypothetical protein